MSYAWSEELLAPVSTLALILPMPSSGKATHSRQPMILRSLTEFASHYAGGGPAALLKSGGSLQDRERRADHSRRRCLVRRRTGPQPP